MLLFAIQYNNVFEYIQILDIKFLIRNRANRFPIWVLKHFLLQQPDQASNNCQTFSPVSETQNPSISVRFIQSYCADHIELFVYLVVVAFNKYILTSILAKCSVQQSIPNFMNRRLSDFFHYAFIHSCIESSKYLCLFVLDYIFSGKSFNCRSCSIRTCTRSQNHTQPRVYCALWSLYGSSSLQFFVSRMSFFSSWILRFTSKEMSLSLLNLALKFLKLFTCSTTCPSKLFFKADKTVLYFRALRQGIL